MYVQSRHFMNNLHHIVLENTCKTISQNILETPSHHQLIMCSIESMAKSTYKRPKLKLVLQWIHHLKVDLLEWAYAQQFLAGALSTATPIERSHTYQFTINMKTIEC